MSQSRFVPSRLSEGKLDNPILIVQAEVCVGDDHWPARHAIREWLLYI